MRRGGDHLPDSLVQEETRTAVPEDSIVDVGDLDLAFLDREVGEKNVTEDNEENDIHVAHTIEAITNAASTRKRGLIHRHSEGKAHA